MRRNYLLSAIIGFSRRNMSFSRMFESSGSRLIG
jgi:hypothetical protein